MGTHQELTTEQLEVLILIDEINKYLAESRAFLEDNISAVIDGSLHTADGCMAVIEVLEYYGYIKESEDMNDDYELTIDGKQYLALFKEYLKQKTNNPVITHNSFTLVNIENLKANIEASLGKINFEIDFGELSRLLNTTGQAIKNWIHK